MGLATLALWGALVLWFDGPASRPAAALLAAGFLAAFAFPWLRLRSRGRAAAVSGLVFALVLGWWLRIPPSNDRDFYAHTILSFQFQGAPPLAISIETRKQKGESYSAVRGFFRQYELVYVMADERDVVKLRTSFRGERVQLYRLTTPKAHARALLEQYLTEANALARQPAWYDAFTQNCTTGIWRNIRAIAPNWRFDWRLLANGYLDELVYELGTVDTRLPLAELRARSDVTERAKICAERTEFSSCIREGLPLAASRE